MDRVITRGHGELPRLGHRRQHAHLQLCGHSLLRLHVEALHLEGTIDLRQEDRMELEHHRRLDEHTARLATASPRQFAGAKLDFDRRLAALAIAPHCASAHIELIPHEHVPVEGVARTTSDANAGRAAIDGQISAVAAVDRLARR